MSIKFAITNADVEFPPVKASISVAPCGYLQLCLNGDKVLFISDQGKVYRFHTQGNHRHRLQKIGLLINDDGQIFCGD